MVLRYKQGGYKYQLAASYYEYTPVLGYCAGNEYAGIDVLGKVVCHKGYAWDGASGPTIDSRYTQKPSLIHDALYQLISIGVIPLSDRYKIDIYFRDRLIECGVDQITETPLSNNLLVRAAQTLGRAAAIATIKARANIWYLAVRQFGGSRAIDQSDREIYTIM